MFPLVGFAHLNWTMTLTGAANDNNYPNSQASLHPTATFTNAHINVEGAWDHTTGKSGIKVGVLDSGIRADHEDLQFGNQSVVVGGKNEVTPTGSNSGTNTNPLQDVNGHGTAVAGIIGAVRNNNLGIAGIAGGNGTTQGVSLYSLKCFDDTGLAAMSDVASAIFDGVLPVSAGGAGAQVLNFSGGEIVDGYRLFLDYGVLTDALRQAHLSKVTMVVSAGNNALTPWQAVYPAQARDSWTLTVGGSDQNGNYFKESNSFMSTPHPFVDVAAPASNTSATGAQTVNTLGHTAPNSYVSFRRTSAAAPHAAGVAALMMSQYNNPSLPADNLWPEDVENLLEIFARDITTPAPAQAGVDDASGAGLINASATLRSLYGPMYRMYHSPAISADPSLPNVVVTPVPGGAKNYYMEGGTRLFPGIYNAQAYKVQITVPVPYYAGFYDVRLWALNGIEQTKSLFGPPVPFTGPGFTNYTPTEMVTMEPEVRVVGRGSKTTVIVEGYAYQLFDYKRVNKLLPAPTYEISTTRATPAMPWIPFNPNDNTSQDGRAVRLAMLTYNPNREGVSARSAFGETEDSAEAMAGAYPNPTTGQATLYFPADFAEPSAQVQLTTLDGQPVRTEKQPIARQDDRTGAVQVSLANLPAGLYLYRIITGTGVRQGRLAKVD
ncbi:S8 family serine peptidase [Hymenobacter monticola]